MFIISPKNKPAVIPRFWCEVKTPGCKSQMKARGGWFELQKHNRTLNNRDTHLHSDSQLRWMQWYLQVAMIMRHKGKHILDFPSVSSIPKWGGRSVGGRDFTAIPPPSHTLCQHKLRPELN